MKLNHYFKHLNKYDCIYVYSDPHFGDEDHGWPTSEERLAKINKIVHKNDCLIILGDVGDVEYVKRIKCGYKILVMGNHDKGASNYIRVKKTFSDSIKFKEEIDILKNKGIDFKEFKYFNDVIVEFDNHLFDEVYEGPLFISDKILLSHEPIKLPFGVNIHGHVHGGVRRTTYSNENVMFNVAADVIDFTPIRIDKLVEGVHCADIHRLAIDKQKKNKKNRDCCMKGGSCQMCDHYKKCTKECK